MLIIVHYYCSIHFLLRLLVFGFVWQAPAISIGIDAECTSWSSCSEALCLLAPSSPPICWQRVCYIHWHGCQVHAMPLMLWGSSSFGLEHSTIWHLWLQAFQLVLEGKTGLVCAASICCSSFYEQCSFLFSIGIWHLTSTSLHFHSLLQLYFINNLLSSCFAVL